MNQVGVTENGRKVYDGCFAFYDRHGYPLAELLIAMQRRNMLPSVGHLALDAMKAGWTQKKFRAWLGEGYGDAFGPAVKEAVLLRFDGMMWFPVDRWV